MTSSPSVADPMISSPPSSSNDGPTVVFVFVFVSLGCFVLLALCLFALWFLLKRRKKKSVEEIEIKHGDEHLKVKEDVVKGPHGSEAVVLSIEEDKHFEEEIIKNEKKVMNHNHGKLKSGEITDLEAGESSSKS